MKRIARLATLAILTSPTLAFRINNGGSSPEAQRETTSDGRTVLPSRSGSLVVKILPGPGNNSVSGNTQIILTAWNGHLRERRKVNGTRPERFRVRPADYWITVEVDGHRAAYKSVNRSDFRGGDLHITVPVGSSDPNGRTRSAEGAIVSVDTLAIPKKAMRELEKAQTAGDGGRTDKALRHLRKAVEIFPDFYQAYNNMGAMLLKGGHSQEAERALRQSLRIRPDNEMALTNLAHIALSENRNGQAIELLSKLIHIDSTNVWAHTFLGESYFRLRLYDAAAPPLERALALDPDAYVASYRLGAILLSKEIEAELSIDSKSF